MIPELPSDSDFERASLGAGSLGSALPGLAGEFHDGEFSVLELASSTAALSSSAKRPSPSPEST
jgi:hypothetical protein